MFFSLMAEHQLDEYARKRTGVGTTWLHANQSYTLVGHSQGKLQFKRHDGRMKMLTVEDAKNLMEEVKSDSLASL